MARLCVGVFAGLALGLGAARAQEPWQNVAPVSCPAVGGQPCDGGPAPCCRPPKVCLPQPDKNKTTKVCYSCACEEFCLPHCLCWFSCCNANCDQPCLTCDGPRVKHILIKKIRTIECDVLKCKPVDAACDQGCPANAPCDQAGPVSAAPANAPVRLLK